VRFRSIPTNYLSYQTDRIALSILKESSSTDRLSVYLDRTSKLPEILDRLIFQRIWPVCDDTWELQPKLLERVRRWKLPFSSMLSLISAADRHFFESLRDPVVLHRGGSIDRVLGMSWTTVWQVAVQFARGHRSICVPDPVIATVTVPLSHIFAVSTDRQESEVLLDPMAIESFIVTRRWQREAA
jgi:hypothetical protein